MDIVSILYRMGVMNDDDNQTPDPSDCVIIRIHYIVRKMVSINNLQCNSN